LMTSTAELSQRRTSSKQLTDEELLTYAPEPPVQHAKRPNDLLLWLTLPIRVVGGCTWAVFAISFLWLTIPTIILHPIFRLLGIPKRYQPSDMATSFWGWSVLKMFGVTIEATGVENVNSSNGTILVSNHASLLDTPCMIAYCGEPVKFVMKRELIWQFPPIFLAAYFTNHTCINRSDRTQAIEGLKLAAHQIRRSKRTIVMFAEGTRTRNGKLLEFKKGPFHLAKETGCPITPVYVSGTYHLLPRFKWFPVPGSVKVTYLPQIPVTAESQVSDLLIKTRRAIIEAIERDTYQVRYHNPITTCILPLAWLIFLLWVLSRWLGK